jgi:hypothetical protein
VEPICSLGATCLEQGQTRYHGMCPVQLTCEYRHSMIWSALVCRYGGTVARDNVAMAADWFVYRIDAVLEALQ